MPAFLPYQGGKNGAGAILPEILGKSDQNCRLCRLIRAKRAIRSILTAFLREAAFDFLWNRYKIEVTNNVTIRKGVFLRWKRLL